MQSVSKFRHIFYNRFTRASHKHEGMFFAIILLGFRSIFTFIRSTHTFWTVPKKKIQLGKYYRWTLSQSRQYNLRWYILNSTHWLACQFLKVVGLLIPMLSRWKDQIEFRVNPISCSTGGADLWDHLRVAANTWILFNTSYIFEQFF